MGLNDTNTIDIIVESPHTGGYDLILVDRGDVKDEIKRYNLIIEKLTSYAEYVISGQLADDHPESHGKEIRFCVIWSVLPPNDAMLRVEALKPRSEPQRRFPVLFMTQDEYLAGGPDPDEED